MTATLADAIKAVLDSLPMEKQQRIAAIAFDIQPAAPVAPAPVKQRKPIVRTKTGLGSICLRHVKQYTDGIEADKLREAMLEVGDIRQSTTVADIERELRRNQISYVQLPNGKWMWRGYAKTRSGNAA